MCRAFGIQFEFVFCCFCFMVVFRKSTTRLAMQSSTQQTSPSATKLIKTNFRFTQNGVKSATMRMCMGVCVSVCVLGHVLL